MVGVNSFKHRFGTVAVFATLFAAIHVNGDKGCVFDFEHVSDFDLECNDIKGGWTVGEDVINSPKKKVLILTPEQDGCFRTKSTVVLNSTSPVSLRFYRGSTKDENSKITLRLVPKEGSCPEKDCIWDITSDSQFKPEEWITAEYKFPLKSMREYYVQLQVDKTKGKFLVDRIFLPTATGNSVRCQLDEAALRAANEAGMNAINLPGSLVSSSSNDSKSFSPGLAEISKNLMLTSASVLTLNFLLN